MWSPLSTGWFQFIVLALLVLIFIMEIISSGYVVFGSKSSFYDPNNIRQYQLVNDQSQSDRQVDYVNKQTSGMTGTRDIPVFFQDYDYDMSLSKTGLSNSREGMTDPEEKKKFHL
jgi:hypothetical protein